MMATRRDITRPIFEGLSNLAALISKPRPKEVLDLEQNIQTTQNRELLSRLRDSLDQYAESGIDLFYIGLMGTFSSGKSSTINSLLNLSGTSEARRTGPNPTDRHITFITHPANEESIISVKRNKHIIVYDKFIKNDLLKHIVLVDTPGSGDPDAQEEMVRDLLPVCDLFLYLFSMSSPFQNEDIPLLIHKFKELPRIPVIFILTRADEFKLVKSQPLNEHNFNQGQANKEIAELWDRMKKYFDPIVDKYEDRIFDSIVDEYEDRILVSNTDMYNIDRLRQALLERSDIDKAETRVEIHTHKLGYYTRNSLRIRDFFSQFLGEKIDELGTIVSNANERIEEYQEGVAIKNNELTETWHNQFRDIEKIGRDLVKHLEKTISLPNSLDELTNEKFSELKNDITEQIENRINDLNELLQKTVLDEVEPRLRNFEKEIENLNINNIQEEVPISRPDLVSATKVVLNFGLIRPEPPLIRKANKIQKEIYMNLSNLQRGLKQQHQVLDEKLTLGAPLKRYVEIISKAITFLSTDVESFLNIVRMYREAVFSGSSKGSYIKLGKDIVSRIRVSKNAILDPNLLPGFWTQENSI